MSGHPDGKGPASRLHFGDSLENCMAPPVDDFADPDEWFGHPCNNGFDGLCDEYYEAALKAEINTNYCFSIAPTGRAGCRGGCGIQIPQGSVRFSVEVEIYHRQPGQATWYKCISCVTPQMIANLEARYGSLEAVRGFKKLNPERQKSVRDRRGPAQPAEQPKKPTKKATKKTSTAPKKEPAKRSVASAPAAKRAKKK